MRSMVFVWDAWTVCPIREGGYMKKNVIYVRQSTGEKGLISKEMQIRMIERYCTRHNLRIDAHYCDDEEAWYSHVHEIRELGLETYIKYPVFEGLLKEIDEGKIAAVIIESVYRIATSIEVLNGFFALCSKWNVTVYEAINSEKDDGNVAIYHRFNSPRSRFCIMMESLDELYKFTDIELPGEKVKMYLDNSMHCRKHMDSILKDTQVQVLIVASYFHINRRTHAMLSFVGRFGKKVYSMQDGYLKIVAESEMAMLHSKMNVAVYSRRQNSLEEEIIKHYISQKTNWCISGWYAEPEGNKTSKAFGDLCKESMNCDIVLVRSVDCLGEETSAFINKIQKLGKRVFSVKEGVMICLC